MTNTGFSRRLALVAGALAVAAMGITVGCSAKKSPAPTAPVSDQVDSKRHHDGLGGEPNNGVKKAPVKGAPARTVNPAEPIAPGQPGRN